MEADAVLAQVANFLLHQQDLHLEVLGIALHVVHRGGDLDRAAMEARIGLHPRFRRRLQVRLQILLELLEHFLSHVARLPAHGLLAVDGVGRHAVLAVALVARRASFRGHGVGTRHVHVVHDHGEILARIPFHGGIEGHVGAGARRAARAGEHFGQHHAAAALFGGLIRLHVNRVGEALAVFRVQHGFQAVQAAVVALLVESFEGLVGGVRSMAAETHGNQIVHRLGVVAGFGGQFAEGGGHLRIVLRDGVGFFQHFPRLGLAAQLHFHPAQRAEACRANLREKLG